MRSRENEHEETKAEVQPTVDPPKKKSADERLDDLEKRLAPLIGPTPTGE